MTADNASSLSHELDQAAAEMAAAKAAKMAELRRWQRRAKWLVWIFIAIVCLPFLIALIERVARDPTVVVLALAHLLRVGGIALVWIAGIGAALLIAFFALAYGTIALVLAMRLLALLALPLLGLAALVYLFHAF